MLKMAQGMKEFANAFKDQFKEDDKVINRIQESQDQNLGKTKAERDKIAAIQSRTFSSFFCRLFMLVLATGVLIGMMFFIWLFPNKILIQR